VHGAVAPGTEFIAPDEPAPLASLNPELAAQTTARFPASFATQATPHPALIPQEVAGKPRRHLRIPARPSSKDLLAA
jgi:hypothetical protein